MQGGRNAFLLCAMSGHLAVAEYLAPKMEGHLFDSDDDGATALHLAAYVGQLSMVEYLVRSCGFDVKAVDKVGLHSLLLVGCVLCPLWTHLLHGHSRHEHLHLSCVAPLFWVSSYTTALLLSAHVPTVDMALVRTQVTLDMLHQFPVCSTAFHCAPSPHVQWGYTPLLRAVGKDHADIARFLLASGSVFNERNSVSARVLV